jgi:uncharacterized membrane protein YccC
MADEEEKGLSRKTTNIIIGCTVGLAVIIVAWAVWESRGGLWLAWGSRRRRRR